MKQREKNIRTPCPWAASHPGLSSSELGLRNKEFAIPIEVNCAPSSDTNALRFFFSSPSRNGDRLMDTNGGNVGMALSHNGSSVTLTGFSAAGLLPRGSNQIALLGTLQSVGGAPSPGPFRLVLDIDVQYP